MKWPSYFIVNGFRVNIKYVVPNHPNLIDEAGDRCWGTFLVDEMTIYINDQMSPSAKLEALVHEMQHARYMWARERDDTDHEEAYVKRLTGDFFDTLNIVGLGFVKEWFKLSK